MEHHLPDYREALADSDPPLGGKIALARESIEALDHKLADLERAQTDLAERIERGDLADHELQSQEAELAKLRRDAERKRRTMAAYLSQLERSLRS